MACVRGWGEEKGGKKMVRKRVEARKEKAKKKLTTPRSIQSSSVSFVGM